MGDQSRARCGNSPVLVERSGESRCRFLGGLGRVSALVGLQNGYDDVEEAGGTETYRNVRSWWYNNTNASG